MKSPLQNKRKLHVRVDPYVLKDLQSTSNHVAAYCVPHGRFFGILRGVGRLSNQKFSRESMTLNEIYSGMGDSELKTSCGRGMDILSTSTICQKSGSQV